MFKLVVASVTKEYSKGLTQLPVANNVPSLSLKFISKSILEGAQFAPTTFQAFKLIVAWTLFDNFQLIVDLFLNPNHEKACADIASATICNESFELIDASNAEGVQDSTLRLNKNLPIWNFDGTSAQTNLVNRIFEASDAFDCQQLIVTIIKTSTNTPFPLCNDQKIYLKVAPAA
jgi:hypothetical protein